MTKREKWDKVAQTLGGSFGKSDRAIAEECKVSPTFVGKVRASLGLDVDRRLGADGRKRGRRRTRAEMNFLGLPGERYGCIVADPPWPIKPIGKRGVVGTDHNQGPIPYATMTVDEIKEFPLGSLALPGCHVYLWTTNACLRDAFSVLDVWGCRFHLCLPLVKTSGVAPCNGYVFAAEYCLLGFFGKPMLDFKACGKLNWLTTTPTPGTHSRKPDEFYMLVEAMSPGPYLDLFSRGRAAEFEEKLVRLGHAIIFARDILDITELTEEAIAFGMKNVTTDYYPREKCILAGSEYLRGRNEFWSFWGNEV